MEPEGWRKVELGAWDTEVELVGARTTVELEVWRTPEGLKEWRVQAEPKELAEPVVEAERGNWRMGPGNET